MSDSSSTSPWLYFLSGSLLPTIAYFVARQISPAASSKEDDDDDDDYDDDEYDDDDESDDGYMEAIGNNKKAAEWGIKDAPYKMVLVVNQELKMGKGKIAAQCGHASVGCYKRCMRMCPSGLRAWEHTGCAKIALKCQTEQEMRQIYDKAIELGLPLYLVEDAGRTQIAAGSRTVLGILGPTYIFENLTSHLKLM